MGWIDGIKANECINKAMGGITILVYVIINVILFPKELLASQHRDLQNVLS
jgi:hypothetical protein